MEKSEVLDKGVVEQTVTIVKGGLKIELATKEDKVDRLVLVTEKYPRITWKPRKEKKTEVMVNGYQAIRRIKRLIETDELPKEVEALRNIVREKAVKLPLKIFFLKSRNALGEVETYYYLQGNNPFEGLNLPEPEKKKETEAETVEVVTTKKEEAKAGA